MMNGKVSGANRWRPCRPEARLLPDLLSGSSLLASCARILGDVLERDQSRPINRAIAFYTRILLIRGEAIQNLPNAAQCHRDRLRLSRS